MRFLVLAALAWTVLRAPPAHSQPPDSAPSQATVQGVVASVVAAVLEVRLTAELAGVRVEFGSAHPTVVALQARLDAVRGAAGRITPAQRSAFCAGVADLRIHAVDDGLRLGQIYGPRHPAIRRATAYSNALTGWGCPSR